MTAKLAAPYGIKEVSLFYHKYAFSGLSVGVIFQFIVIGLYFALRPLVSQEVVEPGFRPWIIVDPPFSGGPANVHVTPSVQTPSTLGTPVPVPMIDVKEDVRSDPTPQISGIAGGKEGALGPGSLDEDGDANGNSGDRTRDLTDPSDIFKENIIYPQVARNVKPEYPLDARRLGMEATVVVKLLIDTNGRPVKAEIFESQNELFNESAKKAALQWLFTPAIANGYFVNVWMNIPFRFKLNR